MDFHLPLPEDTYSQLRAASERAKVPATTLARQAIDLWLAAQAKAALHDEIAAFAAEYGGTEFDLDPDLEAAGIECINANKEPW